MNLVLKQTVYLLVALFVLAPKFLAAHGPLDEQIAQVREEIARNPNDASLYLKRGQLHRFHEDYSAAQKDYDQAARLDPALAAVNLCRGQMMLEAGWYEQALSHLNEFLSQNPRHTDGLVTRARVLAKLGKNLAAAADFTEAILHSAQPAPEYYIERAQAFCNAGAEHVETALRGLDEGVQKIGPIVTMQLYAIELEISLKRYDAALNRLEQIMSASHRKEKWLMRRGEILQLAGRYEEAQAVYQQALKEIETLPPHRRQTKAIQDLQTRLQIALDLLKTR
jgi:tetratricopeptide (TPR) repeat protein